MTTLVPQAPDGRMPTSDAPDAPGIDTSRSIAEQLALIAYRKWLLLFVAVVVAAISVTVAMLLPAMYRSTATILIKEQEIPQEMVRSTITSYADERIQVISQQVMTRATLLDLVEKYDLYADLRKRQTSEEILARMRSDMRLMPISAEITDRRSGMPARSTIAFSLSFDNESPAKAQKVANDLVTLYLNENVKNRQQKAAETTSFLEEEAARLNERISELEDRWATFKRRYQGRTPDLGLANLMGSERSEVDLQRIDREIGFLNDRRLQLQSQLAETRPILPLAPATMLEPEERLRALEAQLVTLSAGYSDNHPDVRRVQREIASLRAEVGPVTQAADRRAQLDRLNAELSALRKRYSDEHPDVARLKRTLTAAEDAVKVSEAAAGDGRRPRFPDNPTYLTLKSQLATTDAQIEALEAERIGARTRLDQFTSRLSQTPEVEREQLELTRDLDSARARFREVREKQMQAEVAEQLERSRKAERFAIVEPPNFPERPYRPNRPLIAMMGSLLGLFAAVGIVFLVNTLDSRVHSARDVVRLMQVPMLAVMPMPALPGVATRRRRLALLSFTALLAIAAAAAWVFHQQVMPLDVAWYGLLRRLDQ